MSSLYPNYKLGRLMLLAFGFVCLAYTLLVNHTPRQQQAPTGGWPSRSNVPSDYDWSRREPVYPIDKASMTRLPTEPPRQLPRIQHGFPKVEDEDDRRVRLRRRQLVKESFQHCWDAYKTYAWGFDELEPLTPAGKNTLSGWGATLVDAADTLWIMDLKEDFAEAVAAIARINWNHADSSECSLFETTIRYLGGLLGAYDLSGEPVLLDKAAQLGHMLYAALDTPNHMPVNHFSFREAMQGTLRPSAREESAALGTLSMEFTRLSQLTGDPKYFDAVERIKREMARTQDSTKLPGMWPVYIDVQNGFFAPGNAFSLGAGADSLYEYLPKMHALLGGAGEKYEEMTTRALETARKHVLFRPMLPEKNDVLFSGRVLSNGKIIELLPESQHLACFAGAMYALAGRLFGSESFVATGDKLARGCAWAHEAMPRGIMPEVFTLVPCRALELDTCEWNETRWREDLLAGAELPRGFTGHPNLSYLLRPEAIESIFVLYRVTGSRDLQEMAWRMFESIEKATETWFGHAAIEDVSLREAGTVKMNSMESFWLAETLKYFYLIFSEPDLISLDDYVFNTEAHPFKIPKPSSR